MMDVNFKIGYTGIPGFQREKRRKKHNTIQEPFFEFHDLRIHREEKEIKSLKDGLYFCQIDKTQTKT